MKYSIETLCKEENSKLTGALVLNLLAKESGKSLPTSGVVAGQAVTSALLQLCGLPGVVYNDIDIFCNTCDSAAIKKSYAWKTELKRIRPESDFKSIAGNTLKTSFHDDVANSSPEDDDFRGYRQISENTQNLLSIAQVGRYSDLNFVWINSNTTGTSKENVTKVLRSFDLNSVKAGVDLKTEELFCTKEFIDWLKTRQVKIEYMHAGIQTLTRFFEKLKHSGNYGNVDLELAKAFCFLTANILENFRPNHDSVFADKHKAWENSSKFPGFKYGSTELLDSLRTAEGWTDLTTFVKNAPHPRKISEIGVKQNSGLSLLGQKYTNRAKAFDLIEEYFEFIPVEGCSLMLPRKAPKLVLDHPEVFKVYFAYKGKGFFGSNSSETCPTRIIDPSVSKAKKQDLKTLYDLQGAYSSYVHGKAAREINRQKMVPTTWLVGAEIAPNDKYLKVYLNHTEELRFLLSCSNIKDFAHACKSLTVNIQKVFSKDDHLFFATLSSFQQLMLKRQRALRVGNVWSPKDGDDLISSQDLDAFEQYNKKGVSALTSLPFAEFILAVRLKMIEAVKQRNTQPLVSKSLEEYLPLSELKDLGVNVVELLTRGDLEAEGLRMRHCVGGYSDKVKQGYSRILSMTDQEGNCSTLELGVRKENVSHTFRYLQNRSIGNKEPAPVLQQAAQVLVSSLNERSIVDLN